MLLDTTFFIDLEEELRSGRPGVCASLLRTHRHRTKHVSVVTMGEFAVGATAAVTLRFFRGYQRLPLGRDVAIFAGRLQSSLPLALGENDLWIAATAKFHGLTLCSRDRILSNLPGFNVLSY